jgi:hypothetical protein
MSNPFGAFEALVGGAVRDVVEDIAREWGEDEASEFLGLIREALWKRGIHILGARRESPVPAHPADTDPEAQP